MTLPELRGIGGGWIPPSAGGTVAEGLVLFTLFHNGVDCDSVDDTTLWLVLVVLTLFTVVLEVVTVLVELSADGIVFAG